MNPYQPPAAPYAGAAGSAADVDVARLRAIARSHRLINLAILANFGIFFFAIVMGATASHANAAISTTLGLALLLAGLASLVGAAWLAYSLGGTVVAILCTPLMFVPFVNIVTLIVMSRIATARLRKAGYKVGLLGADPDAIGRYSGEA